MMHILEENTSFPIEVLNPYLNNEQYKLIISLFSYELKTILERINTEIAEVDREERQFVKLRKSLKFMTTMMHEIVGIISFDGENGDEEEKSDFNLQNLWTETKNIMQAKLEEKKINFEIFIAPELKDITINAEKSTVKQILLNLYANAIIKTKRGKISTTCSLCEDDKSLINIWVEDQTKSIGYEEARRINGALSGSDTNQALEKLEGSNLASSKILTEKLGGKMWVVADRGFGNKINFTFRIYNDDLDFSFDEDIEISDFSSSRDWVLRIPSMSWNDTPFIKNSSSEDNEGMIEEGCWPNILLVDDNYFNIEVLQSLIEVQLQLNWDSAFNGLEAVNKVKERSKNSCCNKHYQFIFMDVNMPIMDGYAASAEIKKFMKDQAIMKGKTGNKTPTKIFAVTAQKEVIENEQRLFDGIILKPISIEGLRNVLK